MDETTLLRLPYIMPGQAQKHVTHNEALRMLDALLHLRVEDRERDDPPDAPAEGQRHALGSAPTGAFAGHAGAIAAFQDGGWVFHQPRPGWVVWDAGAGTLLVFDGDAWVPVVGGAPAEFPLLGINATADETNRLAVAGEATLLNHDGAGHQLKLNKATAGDTVSVLFQSAWSGRAEMGLAGDDDFSVKVSADGETWHTAIATDRATGAVAFPNTEIAGGSADGQVQYRSDGGFAADTHFFYNAGTRRLSVGTTGNNGAITAHATGGVPCLFLTAESGAPYLQMQGGAVWQGIEGGNTQFITGEAGSFIFALRPESGPLLTGLHIANDGRARFGGGAPAGQARLEVDGAVRVGSVELSALPPASEPGPGAILFVPDEAGGATLVFSDGDDWRRLADRAIVS